MLKRGFVFAISCSVLAAACAEPPDETQEIVDNLVKAGFPAGDIAVVDGTVFVGRDAEVSLAASREMLQSGGSSHEQYRTANLISTTLTKICVNGSAFTGVFSTALDLAIQNYDEQPLTFAMARAPSTGCSFTINGVIDPNMNGGVSGFPSGGLPFGTITIGGQLSQYSVDVIEHVITHELGHTIGFRHTDYYNRSISCGTGGNEGDGGVGAIHIPGTPTDATLGGSLMNSCFRSVESGEFAANDVTALRALYGLVAPTPATAIAFQANNGRLWRAGTIGAADLALGLAAGTGPSIARLTTGGYVIAFHAAGGTLWTTGTPGTVNTGFGMMPGTSPSVTALDGGGYEIAFQANNGRLYYYGTAGTADTGLGMAAGTSPSIARLSNNSFAIAFQANTSRLWTTGSIGTADTGFAMAANTSPSITALGAGYEIAFQANNGRLYHYGTGGTADTGLGMGTRTSPSIAQLATGGFQIAFQANTGRLYFHGAGASGDAGFGMSANTSPSLAARPGSGFDVVFNAASGFLWLAGTGGAGDLQLGMAGGTSPSAN